MVFIFLQKKIIRLVVTDFACWVPICVMAFIHFSGAAVLDGVYYVVTAVILLPINSVLNPLLYSDSFEYLWKKSKPLGRRIKQVVCTSPKRDLSAERDLEYFSNKAAKISDKTASVENTNTVITNVSANSTPVLRTKFWSQIFRCHVRSNFLFIAGSVMWIFSTSFCLTSSVSTSSPVRITSFLPSFIAVVLNRGGVNRFQRGSKPLCALQHGKFDQ